MIKSFKKRIGALVTVGPTVLWLGFFLMIPLICLHSLTIEVSMMNRKSPFIQSMIWIFKLIHTFTDVTYTATDPPN